MRWILVALITASLGGTAAAAKSAPAAKKGKAAAQACPVSGGNCACCLQHTAAMQKREAKDATLPKQRVAKRGQKLIGHQGLSDAQAIEADLATIRRRSVDASVPKAIAMASTRSRAVGTGVEQGGARAVAGFEDVRVPDTFGGFLARQGYVRKHGPWHAVHNANRLTAEELRFVERELGWRAPRDPQGNLIKQEGQEDNGYKFLGMHGGMAQAADAAGVTQGRIRPFTQAEWAQLKPSIERRNPDIARGMQMVMDMLAAHDANPNAPPTSGAGAELGRLFRGYNKSIDIFGNWMQTTQQRDANARRLTRLRTADRQAVARTAGLHNLVHVVLSNPGSDMDMGNPEVNLYNELFWLHHGTIEKAREVFIKWYANGRDKAEYERVQAEESQLMNPSTAQGQRMMRTINRFDAKEFGERERGLWNSIQSKISPEATLRATGAL